MQQSVPARALWRNAARALQRHSVFRVTLWHLPATLGGTRETPKSAPSVAKMLEDELDYIRKMERNEPVHITERIVGWKVT